MSQSRPFTTLFMLMSVDGKISPGSSDSRDFDQDFPAITGLKEGLAQYYALEQTTDLWSLNSGRVMAKMGLNDLASHQIEKTPVNFVVIDDGYLTPVGIRNLALKSATLYLLVRAADRPGLQSGATAANIVWDEYDQPQADLFVYFARLKTYGCDRLTIQTGGTLNAQLLRQNLIDQVHLVVAPCLIGGTQTMSLIAGPSLTSAADLAHIKTLELISARPLENSYLELKYQLDGESS